MYALSQASERQVHSKNNYADAVSSPQTIASNQDPQVDLKNTVDSANKKSDTQHDSRERRKRSKKKKKHRDRHHHSHGNEAREHTASKNSNEGQLLVAQTLDSNRTPSGALDSGGCAAGTTVSHPHTKQFNRNSYDDGEDVVVGPVDYVEKSTDPTVGYGNEMTDTTKPGAIAVGTVAVRRRPGMDEENPHISTVSDNTAQDNTGIGASRTAEDSACVLQDTVERVYPGAVAVKGVDASTDDNDEYSLTDEPQEDSPVFTARLVPAGEDVGNLQTQLRQRDELLRQREEQLQSVLTERENVAVAQVIDQDRAAPRLAIRSLKGQGFPHGLADAMALNLSSFALRIWAIDNSGSMASADGARLVEGTSKHDMQHVQCTRWNELQETVKYHAEMAALLKAPTEFRLLNDPGIWGPQQFSIAQRGDDMIDQDMRIALKCMESVPTSLTPLTDHIREIREKVVELEPVLKENGTKVAIVIATDGLPTSSNKGISSEQEFVEALRSFEGLPVWVVVRLCTDDPKVVSFYNKLDAHLEYSWDVLDDFEKEAKEIFRQNAFLNYAMPLHRCREMGYYHRIFDFLDERKLTKDELRDLFTLLFGKQQMLDLPSPHSDWKGFMEGMSRIVENEQNQWNPMTKKVQSWVNLKKLNQAYGGGEGSMMSFRRLISRRQSRK